MSNAIHELGKRAETTKEVKLNEWTSNAFENYRWIKDHPGKHLGEFEKTKSGPCIITWSGASFDKWLLKAKDVQIPVFAGPSQAMALRYHKISPAFILLYDSHPGNFDYLRPDKIKWDCPIITHPSTDPHTLKMIRDEIIWFQIGINYHDSHINDEGQTFQEFLDKWKPDMQVPVSWYFRDEYILFLKNTLRRAYPEIPFRVLTTSCTPIMAMFMASLMGYDPVYMVGADNCFLDNKARADAYRWNTVVNEIERAAVYQHKDNPADIEYKGRKTNTQLKSYRNALIYNMMAMPGQVYEIYDKDLGPGIIDFIPKYTWEEIVEGVPLIKVDIKERIEKASKELKEVQGATS